MKTWKNLFPKICSFENLLRASRFAQRGKRFKREVYEFNLRLEENLLQLKDELESGVWKPGKYRNFHVQEAKKRLISAVPYRDRVVHHALCNIIEPLFDRTFIFDSYACRTGKGAHAAANRYTEFSRKSKYDLKCDISRYFASIRHDCLYEFLSRKITDGETRRLCARIIRSWNDGGELWPSGTGIPIGNLTSQFFANVYLDDFDHWIKENRGCGHYLRYVDDFVVLSDSKKHLHDLLPEIEKKLGGIGLTLHPCKRNVFPVSEGCDFMGYRIWPRHRRIRPKNGYRFQRHLKLLSAKYKQGEIGMDAVKPRVMSWLGHASHADTWGLRRAIFSKTAF
jgi:retron-type reverse transcriptase